MLYDFAVLETENLIKIDAMRYTRKLQFLVRYLGEVFEFELKKGGAGGMFICGRSFVIQSEAMNLFSVTFGLTQK